MLEKYLEEFGFSKSQIKKIMSNRAIKSSRDEDLFVNTVNKNVELLYDISLTDGEIIKLFSSVPALATMDSDRLEGRIAFYREFGFSDKELSKITKRYRKFLCVKVSIFEKRVEILASLGFSKKDIMTMICRYPSVLFRNSDQLKNNFLYIKGLGFNVEEVISIFRTMPQLFSLSSYNIDCKLEILRSLELTDEQIRRMIMRFPALLTLSPATLKLKMLLYTQLGLKLEIVKNAKRLMQSTSVLLGKIHYLRSIGNEEDIYNGVVIFGSVREFINRYGITFKELAKFTPKVK